jgi:hypothetical protein
MLVEARQASVPRSWQEEARLDAQSVWDGCTSECAGFKSSASKLSTACLSEWLSDVDTGAALRLGMLQFISAPSHAFSHRIDMLRLSE